MTPLFISQAIFDFFFLFQSQDPNGGSRKVGVGLDRNSNICHVAKPTVLGTGH